MSLVKAQNVDGAIENMEVALHKLPIFMKRFSKSMLTLDNALKVSSSSKEKVLKDYAEMRDATRRDGLVYSQKILPVATKVVVNLSDYFDNYAVLTFDEWRDLLPDIYDHVVKYQMVCDVLIELHKVILVPLKQRAEYAKTIFNEMKELNVKYEESVKELFGDVKAQRSYEENARMIGNIAGMFSMGVGNIVGEVVAAGHRSDAEKALVKAEAQKRQGKIIQLATGLVVDVLIPAMDDFINGLVIVSTFFSQTKFELDKLEINASNAKIEPKKLYYVKMKKSGIEITNSCKFFVGILPDVRTDMEAIRGHESDKNYVDEWEENAMKKIEEKYNDSQKSIFRRFRDALGNAA